MKQSIITWYGLSTICCLLCWSHTIQSQSHQNTNSKLLDYLKIQHHQIEFRGVVMVVDQKEGILEQHAIGMASLTHQIPHTLDSKFKIASMSKSFIALLVTMAEKKGKLRLDNRLSEYFNDLKSSWQEITIAQLLSHTSGIPHWSAFKDYWQEKSMIPLSDKQILNAIFEMELHSNPGDKASYSSPAYFLLATILEKVYSEDYQTLLKNKVLKPAGLQQTGVYDHQKVISKMSVGYHLKPDNSLIVAPYRNISTMKGGGSLYSTAADISKWCQSFLTNETWTDQEVRDTFTPVSNRKMAHKRNAQYGRGWYMQEEFEGRSAVNHISGGTYGFSTIAAIYPAEQISIVILSNVSFLPMDNLLEDVEKIIFNQPFEMPLLADKTIQLTDSQLAKYSGTYNSNNKMLLKIIQHEHKLYAKLGSNPPFEILPVANHSFYSGKVAVKFTFSPDNQGKMINLETERKGKIDNFVREN